MKQIHCSYSVRREVGAGSPSADTSPQGRGQVTRSPPTGHTHPPSRQSGSLVAGAQSSSPWQHTPAVAPLNQQPPASCLAGNRDWEPPRRCKATRTVKKNAFFTHLHGQILNHINQTEQGKEIRGYMKRRW